MRLGATGARRNGACGDGSLGTRGGWTVAAQARAQAWPGHGGCVGARPDLKVGEERDGEVYLGGCARERRSRWRRLEARRRIEVAGVMS